MVGKALDDPDIKHLVFCRVRFDTTLIDELFLKHSWLFDPFLATWVWFPKIGYIPNYSHLIGIMISKTIGFRDTLFSDTPTWSKPKTALPWSSGLPIWSRERMMSPGCPKLTSSIPVQLWSIVIESEINYILINTHEHVFNLHSQVSFLDAFSLLLVSFSCYSHILIYLYMVYMYYLLGLGWHWLSFSWDPKAKRRMEEERMGKLEKYREDYEVPRWQSGMVGCLKSRQFQWGFNQFQWGFNWDMIQLG